MIYTDQNVSWRPVASLWPPQNALVLHPTSQPHPSCQPNVKPSANAGCPQDLKPVMMKPARKKMKTATRTTMVCHYFDKYNTYKIKFRS